MDQAGVWLTPSRVICRTSRPSRVIVNTCERPARDEELAAGFLFSEAIVTSAPALIERIPCPGAGNNVLNVTLAVDASAPCLDPDCGVEGCGGAE